MKDRRSQRKFLFVKQVEEEEERKWSEDDVRKFIENLIISDWDIVVENLAPAFRIKEIKFTKTIEEAVDDLAQTIENEIKTEFGEEVLYDFPTSDIKKILGDILFYERRFDETIRELWEYYRETMIEEYGGTPEGWKQRILEELRGKRWW